MEARALVRLLYENVLWLNMVKLRGAKFVEEMREDEIANRKALAQLTMELTRRHGGDVNAPGALKIRSVLKDFRMHHPEAKLLEARAVAANGGLEMIYFEYKKFSLDAVHCSVTALGAASIWRARRRPLGTHIERRSEHTTRGGH